MHIQVVSGENGPVPVMFVSEMSATNGVSKCQSLMSKDNMTVRSSTRNSCHTHNERHHAHTSNAILCFFAAYVIHFSTDSLSACEVRAHRLIPSNCRDSNPQEVRIHCWHPRIQPQSVQVAELA